MAYTKSEAGKGDDNRTKNWKSYWDNYENIFKKDLQQQQKAETICKKQEQANK